MSASGNITSTEKVDSRKELLLSLAMTLAAGAAACALFLRRGMWLIVIGYNVAPAERVLHGEVPYRDFLYNYTPALLWLNALLMKLFGPTMMTVRAGVVAFRLATLVMLLLVGRHLKLGWGAMIPVALTLAWFDYKYVFGVYPTQYSMLFILLALLFTLRHNRSGEARWLLLAGLAAGVVFEFKYNVGLLLLAAGTATILASCILSADSDAARHVGLKRAGKSVGLFWISFVVVAGIAAVYLARDGALGPMVDHFLHHAAEYSERRSAALPSPRLLGPSVAAALVVVIAAIAVLRKAPRYFAVYVFSVVGLAAVALLIPTRAYVIKSSASAAVAYLPIFTFAAVAAFLAWRGPSVLQNASRRADWWNQNGAAAIVGVFALAAYLEVYPRADYYHLVRAMPPVFLFLTILAARARPALEIAVGKWSGDSARAAALCLLAPLMLLVLIGIRDTWQVQFDARGRFIDRVPLSVERAEGFMVSRKRAVLIEGLTRVIDEHSAPDDAIFSFAQRGTAFYFLTGRKNPTRLVWWRSVGIKDEDRGAVLAMMASRTFKLVLLREALNDQRVRQTLDERYHKIWTSGDIAVYERNE